MQGLHPAERGEGEGVVADIVGGAGGRHPAVVSTTPGRGEVDLGLGIDEGKRDGEIPGQ